MKRYHLYPLALLWAVTIPAHAVETKISGFMTASVNMLDSDEVEYIGINDYPTFDTDSVLGVQFDTSIDDQLSLTAQLVAKDSGEGNDLTAPWGYLTYLPQPNHRFRAGRLGISDFYYSDSVNISYAYPWIRTPVEVYGNVPITSYNGVEYSHFTNLGSVDLELGLRAGGFDESIELGGATTTIKSKTYWGVNAKLFYKDLSMRLSAAQPRMELVQPAIEGFLNMIEEMGESSVIKDLRNDDVKVDFYNLALHYDSLNVLLFAEGTLLERDAGSLPDQTSYYVGGGYHIGNWLPTLTFVSRSDDARTDLIGDTANPVVAAMVTGFVEAFVQDQETIILSLRWDFHKAAALKFEMQQIKPKSDTAGLFDVVDPAYKQDAVNLYGISISSTF